MGKVIILPETSLRPITLIGSRAGYCWGADVSDNEKNYKRGLDCIESNHGRTLEYVNVEMVLDGYSARVIREWYTHIGGAPTRLQASTRYINYADFEYVTPKKVEANPEAKAIYDSIMEKISEAGRELEALGIPREDSAMILPLGMTTKIVDRRNLRNLIDMSRQRMCTRAYWEYRELFSDICKALSEYSEEWKQIIDSQMMPKCELLGYCPERYCCGRKPKKSKE
ncbi:MAG: FAD-dependent thymidylate synthase [Clostridia bacterium]|nr:FAD-dependent thymidylate synthase [Clostridia bacterium]